MSLPSMAVSERLSGRQTIAFRGLNHAPVRAEGELYDMQNLSGALYPVLTVRPARRQVYTVAKPHGLCAAAGKLCFVDGTQFIVDGTKKGSVTDGEKQFARLGTYLLIFPDKAYYHLQKDEFGALEASWTGSAQITNHKYDAEGDAETVYAGNAIKTSGAAFPFQAGDAVTIAGSAKEENNRTSVIREIISGKTLVFTNNTFTETAGETLTISRTVPDMEYFCENENRLWGCKGNELYASALGNPFRWNNLEGLSTDSYAVTVGTDGAFTGACSYLGYAIFFKERAVHKIYGSKPANFQVMTSAAGGVAAGAAATLSIANETLFYLGTAGMQSYSGGVPVSIAGAFGGTAFTGGCAGADGNRYYASLQSADGWALYCYDALRGMWHKEDAVHALGFGFARGALHMLTADGGIYALSGGTDAVPWMLDTGDMDEGSMDKKSALRLRVRIELNEGASARMEIQYDSDDVWRTVREVRAGKKRTAVLPLIPRRCDHYRLRLSGTGHVRLYGMVREYFTGSER